MVGIAGEGSGWSHYITGNRDGGFFIPRDAAVLILGGSSHSPHVETPLQTYPEECLLGDSRPCQVGSED